MASSFILFLGIPFLTHAEKESIKDHILEKHAFYEQESLSSESSPGFISPVAKKLVEVPPEQKDFVDAVWWES